MYLDMKTHSLVLELIRSFYDTFHDAWLFESLNKWSVEMNLSKPPFTSEHHILIPKVLLKSAFFGGKPDWLMETLKWTSFFLCQWFMRWDLQQMPRSWLPFKKVSPTKLLKVPLFDDTMMPNQPCRMQVNAMRMLYSLPWACALLRFLSLLRCLLLFLFLRFRSPFPFFRFAPFLLLGPFLFPLPPLLKSVRSKMWPTYGCKCRYSATKTLKILFRSLIRLKSSEDALSPILCQACVIMIFHTAVQLLKSTVFSGNLGERDGDQVKDGHPSPLERNVVILYAWWYPRSVLEKRDELANLNIMGSLIDVPWRLCSQTDFLWIFSGFSQ